MDIKISKSARVCRACERDFVHDEPVNSVVRIHEKELLREDFCANCWTQDRKASAYSHWNTKYYDPRVAEQEPAEAFSPLRQLFYEAVEAEDRVEQAKAFLAAQLLRRQKVFRQIKESDELDGEVKIILFNDRIGNRLIEVRDPNFSYAELEQGRVLLMQRLQELEAPAKPTETASTAEETPKTEVDAGSDDETSEEDAEIDGPDSDSSEDDDESDVEDDDSDDEDDEDDDEDEDEDDEDDDDDEEDDDDDEEDDEDDDEDEEDEDEYDDDDDDEDDEDEDEDDEDEDDDGLAEEEEEEEEKATAHVR